MTASSLRRATRWAALGIGVAAATYCAVVAAAYYRYGYPPPPRPDEADPALDPFMPIYEVAERHQVRVLAPAAITLRAATEVNLQDSAVVSAIFKARELVLGSDPAAEASPQGLLAQTLALGWHVLHKEPGREIVVGAVTQPWEANVVFRGLAPDEFKAFREPNYVKIAWTLRVESVSPAETIFRTETRVVATDPTARARFRWYWARFSPGIVLIRQVLLRQLKADAERHVPGLAQPA